MTYTKKILVFESSMEGHILEYIHHLYMMALGSPYLYVFAIPESFNTIKETLDWPQTENVKFRFITDSEITKCQTANTLKSAIALSKCIKKYAIDEKIDHIFLLYMIRPMPILPLILPSNIKVSGIIYNIPLYHKNLTFSKKIINGIIYRLFAISQNIKNVFMLNDPWGAEAYNTKYKTDKFKYLTDPIPEIDMSAVQNLRAELNIADENKIYLQFGSLDERKNTLNILRALLLMSQDELHNKTFIFSGKLSKEIKEEFYTLVNSLKDKVQIVVKEGFVTYDYLNSLCFTSDYLLTLYNNVTTSSGTIGYAAYFRKPVIGPSTGLLGKLIIENKLGYTIENTSPSLIKEALLKNLSTQGEKYCISHSTDEFCKTLFLHLN